jgi:CheY-like chemotaxis protein
MVQIEFDTASWHNRAVNSMNGSETTRILLIDDDVKLCRLISYLQPLGYDVVAENTGPNGLRRALSESFSAILLDVMLPDLNGFDLLRELRKESQVPVLMLTALARGGSYIALEPLRRIRRRQPPSTTLTRTSRWPATAATLCWVWAFDRIARWVKHCLEVLDELTYVTAELNSEAGCIFDLMLLRL